MRYGIKQTGETVNATVSLNSNTYQYTYGFSSPYDMLINLNNAEDMVVNGTSNNDKFSLLNAGYVVVNAGKGNDIFAVSGTTGSLNGNILRGGDGYDFITIGGSNSEIDLTEGVTSIEAVVGRKALTGSTVHIDLGQMGSSDLTDGAKGRAFAAVIGTSGEVIVDQPGSFHLVGIVDQAGNGYTATGAAITGSALASLVASVTDISEITGNLAALFAGTEIVPNNEKQVSTELNAYVFSNGNKSYTVWTDGTVVPIDKDGNVQAAAYNPDTAIPATPLDYGMVETFDADSAGRATISFDANYVPKLVLTSGTTDAYTAIALTAEVSDSTVSGNSLDNGLSWFGLGKSGGYNHIVGSVGGNIFDLQGGTYLNDRLTGGKGFDVVRIAADGTDLDLTKDGGTGYAATGIDAVVGSLNVDNLQTVELNIDNIKFTVGTGGEKIGVFEALLGSTDDILNISGSGKWVEISTFAPDEATPEHASELVGADILDALFGVQPQNARSAENSLVGHLFAEVNGVGTALKYLTIYTDATIQSSLNEGVLVA